MRKSFRIVVAAVTVLLIFGPSVWSQEMTAMIQVTESAELGPVLVDGEGLGLYLFTRDEEGVSNCTDQCAQSWPPVLVGGQVAFGPGVSLDLMGTIERPDGSSQLTYGGWPLYRYAQDSAAGEYTGHAANDVWFLLNPSGEPARATAAGQDEEAGAQEQTAADQQAPDAAFATQAQQDPAGKGEAEEPAGAEGQEAGQEHPADAAGGDAEDAAAGEADLEALMVDGQGVFNQHCATCHGRNGRGTQGGAAVLAGNRNLSDGPRTARQVLYGGQLMPPFQNVLDDHQVAAVVTYVRNSWGNDFGPFTEEEVVQEKQRFQ